MSNYQGDEGHIGWIIKGRVHCIPCALKSGETLEQMADRLQEAA